MKMMKRISPHPLDVPHNSFFVSLTSHLSSDIHGQRGHQNNLSLSLFCSVLRHVINNFGEGREVFMTQSLKGGRKVSGNVNVTRI